MDNLPIPPSANAVEIILDIMREHPGLRFCRSDGGSRWPIYPRDWTAGQRAPVQSLWLMAGDALDTNSFEGWRMGNRIHFGSLGSPWQSA